MWGQQQIVHLSLVIIHRKTKTSWGFRESYRYTPAQLEVTWVGGLRDTSKSKETITDIILSMNFPTDKILEETANTERNFESVGRRCSGTQKVLLALT